MKRSSLYSSSNRTPAQRADAKTPAQPPVAQAERAPRRRLFSARSFWQRFDRPLLVVAGAVFALALTLLHARLTPAPRELTQDDIDKAVLHTLQTKEMPSPAA